MRDLGVKPGHCQCGCGHRWSRVPTRHPGFTVDPITGCWLWLGYLNPVNGYAFVKDEQRRTLPAHRAYYLKHRGPIPDGYDLDHLCRVRRCVNPAHLEPVTPAENVRRGVRVRLTAAQAQEIRALVAQGVMQKDLAGRFGVHRTHVSKIVSGRKWA